MMSRLTVAALERAIVERQPPAGVVHHSDRGFQYASAEYVTVLAKHRMISSMSRPANPYDNASCESFRKTLKREEIYANRYHDLDHMRANVGFSRIRVLQTFNESSRGDCCAVIIRAVRPTRLEPGRRALKGGRS